VKIVSNEEMNKLFAEIDAEKLRLAEKMPTEQDAINQIQEAYTRLKDLGWNDAIYSPKDGSWFSSISVGSTGIHKCCYSGEWPKGGWHVWDGDLWHSQPCLWRPRKDSDPEIDLGLATDYRCCDA
jgi:hypothetical protein